MKRMIPALLLMTAVSARADGPTSQEQALLDLVDKGKKNASVLIAKTPKTDSAHARPSLRTPTPALPGDEDLISKLSRQVDSLKQKDALERVKNATTQRPKDVKRVGTKTVYDYKDGAIYEIHAGVDRITDIELQQGEGLTGNPVSGDTVRWKISVLSSGKGPTAKTHLILKPLESDIETNFILTTDRHTYHLRAMSSDWYMPSVTWNYPQEESPEYQDLVKKQQNEEPLVVSADKLNFSYEIDGRSYSWKPVRVFDDGEKTYLQMPPDLRVGDAPVLFIIDDEEDEPALVNYRVKGTYYIVDRLFTKAELRVGKNKSVEIEKEDPRPFYDRLWY